MCIFRLLNDHDTLKKWQCLGISGTQVSSVAVEQFREMGTVVLDYSTVSNVCVCVCMVPWQ